MVGKGKGTNYDLFKNEAVKESLRERGQAFHSQSIPLN